MFNNYLFDKHLMKACLAAVFAIGLTACSSSSDTATAPDPDPGPPDPAMACADGGGQWNADDMTCTSAEELELAALRAQIAALAAQLGVDADDIGTTVAELQATLKELQDAAAKMASDAAVKAAMALFVGMGDTTNFVVDTIVVGDEDGGGGMATFTSAGSTPLVPGVAGDDTMKSAEPMLGKWQGTMLTDTIAADADTNPGASTTVVVYTDIEAPKAVKFGDVYTLDGNGNLAGTGDADANVLHADNRSKIKASAFVHTGRKNHDPDPTAANDVAMIRGSFNGASGEYRCTAATATSCASHDAGDGVVRLEGAWVFDPDSGAMAMMADASYAYFGWWLNKGTATEGTEAGVFHGVTDLTGDDAQLAAPTAANFTPLGGTATYTGAAAGKYAINPGLSAASGGHWTADATLTADFGSETANGTISGMIENFMSGDTAMDWSVALGATALSDAGVFSTTTDTSGDTANNAVVWTIGGVDGTEAGSWEGALYGEGDNNVPTVTTGMFTGTHGTVGHIVGAFGADL
ncbi:MAG: hypothetical protein OXI73_16115 [Rhodospirillales bacterium]|nr:hypothetical protein [Rhodospirillales bacterium]